ncbi:PREDICTED: DNA polymerase delta subunit 3-like [Acropora digitifera]|uniref:DNA polymerase delta subunit 3-like n=1 Tax=Acropora digitifera TaxID=70779 RepID=UPI00077A0C4A|nr:PREDICTED: DNA polymerase delta subunit 3-like [Acropora digitifera]
MADEESELYLENLDEFVNDEDKIVTYKWLSRTLSVPANKAKHMLYAFVQKQRASNSLHELNITYFIGGRCVADEDTVHKFFIIHEKDLEESKKTFSVVTSLHIYSVQRCKLKDSNSLYTVDYDIQQKYKSEGNRLAHFLLFLHQKPMLINIIVHQALDAKTRKGQMSAIDMFAVKASTSKPEKSSSKKENATQERKVEPKAAETLPQGNKSGSKKSFFGKHSTDLAVKKASEKLRVAEDEKGAISNRCAPAIPDKQNSKLVESVNSRKRELSSDDEEDPLPAKLSRIANADSKDKDPEDKPKKRRKRMKELPREDSTDDEAEASNAEKKHASDPQVCTKSDEPLPQRQARQPENETGQRKRKKKRELKSKTYMDDQGFMVTEKLWESDSTDASDNEVQLVTTEPPLKDRPPSPAKKTSKKTHAEIKNKGAKQASLISFFKKS